jgi:hypothetical protein
MTIRKICGWSMFAVLILPALVAVAEALGWGCMLAGLGASFVLYSWITLASWLIGGRS